MNNNNKNVRQNKILQYIEQQGACSYQQLAEFLGASNMTIRRDIDSLAEGSRLIKTIGGAQKANAPESYYETFLLSRLSVNKAEKVAIAKKAIAAIKPGDCIYLDGSSTCIELSKLLVKNFEGLTIITNSGVVYWEIARWQTKNVLICLGGQHDPTAFCTGGPATEEHARKYFLNKAFVSTKGFIPTEGTYESTIATFRIKQIMAEKCNELYLLVDHSKFGNRALSKVLDVSQIHTVITDDQVGEDQISLLKERNIEIVVAETESSALCG